MIGKGLVPGILFIAAGVYLLLLQLGIIPVIPLGLITQNLWPLLIILAGVLLILNKSGYLLVVLILLVVLFFGGIGFYSWSGHIQVDGSEVEHVVPIPDESI